MWVCGGKRTAALAAACVAAAYLLPSASAWPVQNVVNACVAIGVARVLQLPRLPALNVLRLNNNVIVTHPVEDNASNGGRGSDGGRRDRRARRRRATIAGRSAARGGAART